MPGTFLIQCRSSREIAAKLSILFSYIKFDVRWENVAMDFSVNPLLLNVISPSIGGEEKYFSIQVTGEALWQWRQIKPTYPENCFRALNKSLEKLSYEVASHASDRLGRRIKIEGNFLSAKLDGKNSKTRKEFTGKFLRVFQGDARYTKSIYALLSRSFVWSLLCYCVRDRNHCCVLCDVTRDLLFTWYIVHQPHSPCKGLSHLLGIKKLPNSCFLCMNTTLSLIEVIILCTTF